MKGGNFNANAQFLSQHLFQPYNARHGAQTLININYIPDFYIYLKTQLTPEELLRLESYHLQTYLMELSINLKQKMDFQQLADQVLDHIRNNNSFWYKRNIKEQLDEEKEQKHHAIEAFHGDVSRMNLQFCDRSKEVHFTPNHSRKLNYFYDFMRMRKCQETTIFCNKFPLNHLSFLPMFIFALYEKQSTTAIPSEQKESHSQMLECCILYLVSCKAPSKKNHQNNQSSSSIEDQDDQQIQPGLEVKSKIQEFMEWVEEKHGLSNKIICKHQMYNFTANAINICLLLLKISMQLQPSGNIPQKIFSNQYESTSINIQDLQSESYKSISTTIFDKELLQPEVETLANGFKGIYESGLKFYLGKMSENENENISESNGFLISDEEMKKVKESYLRMLENPQFMELTRYKIDGEKIPWDEKEYLSFLKGLAEFINIPTNNKRISTFMGANIEPNHVKHMKAVYLNNMKERLDKGECGGGKKGKSLSKLDFLEKDIANFTMKWFEKKKKIKKKRIRRRKKNSSEEDLDEDLDSEY